MLRILSVVGLFALLTAAATVKAEPVSGVPTNINNLPVMTTMGSDEAFASRKTCRIFEAFLGRAFPLTPDWEVVSVNTVAPGLEGREITILVTTCAK